MDRSQGAKGSLPGKTAVSNFLKKLPIKRNESTTSAEHVSIVKANYLMKGRKNVYQ